MMDELTTEQFLQNSTYAEQVEYINKLKLLLTEAEAKLKMWSEWRKRLYTEYKNGYKSTVDRMLFEGPKEGA